MLFRAKENSWYGINSNKETHAMVFRATSKPIL